MIEYLDIRGDFMSKRKNNFYAVRKGKCPGIYGSWDECSKQVQGFSGAEYKGFKTKYEAELYLNSGLKPDSDQVFDDVDIIIYVDGSFDPKTGVYGYGYVAITKDGNLEKFCNAGNNKESAVLRNVAGEMLAAMCAVRYAIKNKFKSVLICYDYTGIESWVTDGWQTKNKLTTQYSQAMKEWGKEINISFKKISAHTGEVYNEMADQLAKQAVTSFIGGINHD